MYLHVIKLKRKNKGRYVKNDMNLVRKREEETYTKADK